MIQNSKGQIRILEAFFATLLVFSSLIVSTGLSPSSNRDNHKFLVDLGTQVLITLDCGGTLGKLIDQKNWTAIRGSLSLLLPVGVSFNLTVYGETDHPLNNVTISNGLRSNEVISVQYPCVSQGSACNCYLACLQLSEAD
ncbi:MAG: hypothetical protein U9O89_05455 [Thermoproteota archaeon]|nr:hypothetical protein [Thermoproteota archaeon]